MNCKLSKENIHQLLDERLGSAEAADLRAHMAGCPECRRHYSELSLMAQTISERPSAQPSNDFKQSVMAKIGQIPAHKTVPLSSILSLISLTIAVFWVMASYYPPFQTLLNRELAAAPLANLWPESPNTLKAAIVLVVVSLLQVLMHKPVSTGGRHETH
ncbi:MAG TPA: zf-HC2 domain-containing protein [Elusimicrobiales bacterium]|nr:zf-HC2 domain-containing protein [Elusimicrobiales bacterium]